MLVRVELVRVEAYVEEGIRGRRGGQEWKTRVCQMFCDGGSHFWNRTLQLTREGGITRRNKRFECPSAS